MVDHVAANDGLQLIEYMPEIAGHPEWAIDIDRVHDWLADRADRLELGEMHGRRRYYVSGDGDTDTPNIEAGDSNHPASGMGMVEIVDPVENRSFCANCHRVRVTHDGQFKGCLNRHDDHRSMGGMSREKIRAAFREPVANRVPYYGEYPVEEDGGWVQNERYVERSAVAADDD